MVEEGAAESPHEEVVAEREFTGDLPQAQLCAHVAVVAHDQRAAVSPGDELVVGAAVDLHLVVIERMDQIPRDQTVRQRIAFGRLKRERSVRDRRQVIGTDLVFGMLDHLLRRHEAFPDLRQAFHDLAVAVALAGTLGRDFGKRLLKTREIGEEIVEAAVLGKDHHDRIDRLPQLRIADGSAAALPLLPGRRHRLTGTARHGSGTERSGKAAEEIAAIRANSRAFGLGFGTVGVGHGRSLGEVFSGCLRP